AALAAVFVALEGHEKRAEEAHEDDGHPEKDDEGGDDGFGSDGVGNVGCHFVDRVGDFGWELDFRVIRDPVKTFLDTSNLEANETVHDFHDGIVEDCPAEGHVKGFRHTVDEYIEGLVQRARGGVDPAKDILVDVVVCRSNGVISPNSPCFGGVVQGADNLPCKVSNLVFQCRDFLLDCLEEGILTQTGKKTGKAEIELCSGRDPCTARVRPRGNVNDVHLVERVLTDKIGPLLHRSPSSNLAIGHGNAGQNCSYKKNDDEDLASNVGYLREFVEEGSYAVIVRAECELFFLRHWEQSAIHMEGMDRGVDERFDFFEWEPNGSVGEIVDLGKVRNGFIQFIQTLIETRRKSEMVQRIDCRVHVDGWNAAFGPKYARELVEISHETVDIGRKVMPNTAERLVEKVACIFDDLQRNVQTPAHSEGDEANVGRGQHVDVEDNNLLDAGDSQEEHGHQAVDSLFHAMGGQLIDAL
ncbi:MAG: hypothetical protein LQ347_006318, partial [Umbilicaria vellea]